MDYTPLVLSQCMSITWKVAEARMMKDRCRQLGQKVYAVEEMVRALQTPAADSITPQVGGALQKLYSALMDADDLVQRCTSTRTMNKSKYKTEFSTIDQRIKDSMRVLATVPHSSHRTSTPHPPSAHAAPARHAPPPYRGPPTSHAPARALHARYPPAGHRAPATRRAQPVYQVEQTCIVEEVDDDLDGDFGVVVPYVHRGVAAPRVHGRRGYQASVVLLEDGTLLYT